MTYEIDIGRSSVENYSNCDATSGSASGCVQYVISRNVIVVATVSSRKKICILIVILTVIHWLKVEIVEPNTFLTLNASHLLNQSSLNIEK
jgi:hypothetical protein